MSKSNQQQWDDYYMNKHTGYYPESLLGDEEEFDFYRYFDRFCKLLMLALWFGIAVVVVKGCL